MLMDQSQSSMKLKNAEWEAQIAEKNEAGGFMEFSGLVEEFKADAVLNNRSQRGFKEARRDVSDSCRDNP